MFVRRGPLRHARMLVAITCAADDADRRSAEPEPAQPLARLEDLAPDPGRPSGSDPQPEGVRDSGG